MEKIRTTKILKFALAIVQIAIFALIFISFAVEDWVRMNKWTGSLFYCESGEYKNQQYFSIRCSSTDCPGKRFGMAGVAYVICSVFSLFILVAWLGFTIYQYKSETKPQMCTRIFFTVGSAGLYYFGILMWIGISGVLNPFDEFRDKCGVGPKVAMISAILYSLAVVCYYIPLRNDDKILMTQDGENKTKDLPDMKSVKIEGRFVYPSSIEYEEHEADN